MKYLIVGLTIALTVACAQHAIDDKDNFSLLFPDSTQRLVFESEAVDVWPNFHDQLFMINFDRYIELLKREADLSVNILRLDPKWDPLREHQRFIKLIAN